MRSIPRPATRTRQRGSRGRWKRPGSISIRSSTCEELVKETVKALRPILPIRFEELRLAVRIPADNAARAYGDIAAASTMEKDEWQKDGSWVCVVRIPAGIQGEFYDLVNKISKGEGQVKILNQVY